MKWRPGSAAQGRLSGWQAALVVARRDLASILFSRAFLFFLAGPLFPVIVGLLAGTLGQQIDAGRAESRIGIAMSAPDTEAMLAARGVLAAKLGRAVPGMVALEGVGPDGAFDAAAALRRDEGDLAAIVGGTPDAPVLTATPERIARWQGLISLTAATATERTPTAFPPVRPVEVASSGASVKQARMITAQAGQALLFLLIMLLAGMVLSNLVEEKGNKIIEILAAAIPMDAVFLGKLFAMLGVSLVGLTVWGSVAALVLPLAGFSLSGLPAPGVGWPLFLALGVVYFATGYLLVGSIFLAIGSLASTVREVQTLSMPVTMGQVLIFFLGSYAAAHPGEPAELAAIAFPLSSPFTMIARAAQDEAVWPHLAAIAWQGLWVAIFVRAGAAMFRSRVMKSGAQGGSGRFLRWRRRGSEPGADTAIVQERL
ncbi:ABC transporter permease [Altericroceibacterium xinjiangense]|uniref:ABC transporter permease n=1 Tax=Altericroceibacterium xinjiangense TaxID=762261 RepID=UPI000F7F50C2|nr:ABC transporter permease [Altericroceibacterium xinjiangense]